jgi:hypothetical protein
LPGHRVTPPFRIIDVAPGARLTLANVTVTNGSGGPNDEGGGLFNEGSMVLTGDRVAFNHSTNTGGGVLNASAVTLRRTVVAFNTPDNCSPQGTIPGCRH